jgi:RNA polymerase sigma-70 factor (ECF subfamily)
MADHEKEFVKLLIGHQSLIRAFVISLLPGMSEAEDVIQNTNEVLWVKRQNFELGTNFKAWALTTARYQAMALQQKLKREKRAPLDDDVLMLVSEDMEEKDPDEINQNLSNLDECIGQLQVKDQELVLHRYWKKSGLTDYSKASGRSVGSLKVALFRLRSNLRTCLEQKMKTSEDNIVWQNFS